MRGRTLILLCILIIALFTRFSITQKYGRIKELSDNIEKVKVLIEDSQRMLLGYEALEEEIKLLKKEISELGSLEPSKIYLHISSTAVDEGISVISAGMSEDGFRFRFESPSFHNIISFLHGIAPYGGSFSPSYLDMSLTKDSAIDMQMHFQVVK